LVADGRSAGNAFAAAVGWTFTQDGGKGTGEAGMICFAVKDKDNAASAVPLLKVERHSLSKARRRRDRKCRRR